MKEKRSGFVAFATVIIISAVVLSLATTVSLLSIGDAQSSFSLIKGENNLQFVEGCMEDALLKARNNPAYNGGTISRPEGNCSVQVAKNGNNWTMTVTTIDIQYKRTIQTIFTRSSSAITLTSWKEI